MLQPIGIFDLFDQACADELDVSIKHYVDKIERTTDMRSELIISALLYGNEVQKEKAKRLFAMIK